MTYPTLHTIEALAAGALVWAALCLVTLGIMRGIGGRR